MLQFAKLSISRYEVFKAPGDAELCAQLGTAAGVLLRSCAAMHPGANTFRTCSRRLDALLREDRERCPHLHNLGHYANESGDSNR